MLVEATKDSLGIFGTFITSISAACAALIGVLAGKIWDANRESKNKQHLLVIRYLSQLQITMELLEDRLDNLLNNYGRTVMTEEYFRSTTLYALACPLALERIFMLDGIYPQIYEFNKDLYSELNKWSLDKQLKNYNFHHYDRLALA